MDSFFFYCVFCKEGSCWVSVFAPFFPLCEITLGAVPHVITYWRWVLLKPLIVDCR